MIWYVQVAALVIGHVAGLAVAHDRAVGMFRTSRMALWTQYPMLVLMVLFTVGGLCGASSSLRADCSRCSHTAASRA